MESPKEVKEYDIPGFSNLLCSMVCRAIFHSLHQTFSLVSFAAFKNLHTLQGRLLLEYDLIVLTETSEEYEVLNRLFFELDTTQIRH
jgi:hypothetical protein